MRKIMNRANSTSVPKPDLLIFILALACILSIAKAFADESETIKSLHFVTGDNCPYSCASDKKPGLWVEFTQALLEPLGYKVIHELRPIKRVHHEVQSINQTSDSYRFSIRAARSLPPQHKIPGTLMSARPILFYRGCFVTRKGYDWSFKGFENSEPVKLGLTDSLDYSSLSAFLSRPDQANLTIYTVGDNPALTNIKLLIAGRIDATVSSHALVYFLAAQEGLTDMIAMAGCDESPKPFYLLFPQKHSLTQKLIEQVDRHQDELARNGTVKAIYRKYGIPYQELD